MKSYIENYYTLDFNLTSRTSMFWGMTINIKKYGENLNYYDINSSYPYIMRDEEIPYDI